MSTQASTQGATQANANVNAKANTNANSKSLSEWPLWEVFIRSKQGLEHKHCGSLHASDAQHALQLQAHVVAAAQHRPPLRAEAGVVRRTRATRLRCWFAKLS